jgi:Alginate lyase/Immunoglobulin I-set domain
MPLSEPATSASFFCAARLRLRGWALGAFAALAWATTALAALNPGLPPGKNFDLSHWHLTLPDSGASTITPSSLNNGYSNATWFYTGADGAMTFYAPVNGGTTSGSEWPRTELRERINPSTTTANWTWRGAHILEAECRVLQQPSTGELWFGQIHGYLDNVPALFLLHYSNGVVRAQFRTNPVVAGTVFLPLTNVALNEPVRYRIEFAEGLLTASVNGAMQRINVVASDAGWTNQNFYFKAGSYCRDNVGPATEGARVSFYSLQATHQTSAVAPVVIQHPASVVTAPGATVALPSFALGTPPLVFQWFKNGAALPARTNALLTFTNIVSTNAGAYHCLITNAFGTATTALAEVSFIPPPAPVVSLLRQPDQVRLVWTAAPGRAYRVQAKADLEQAVWADLAAPVLLQGTQASFAETFVSSNRFFRVLAD